MAKRQFTEEELALLRRNPYTAFVDENSISFTVPFKIEYMRLHNEGVPPREILPRLGYPIEIIGRPRLIGISQSIRGEAASKLGFRETKHKKMSHLLDVSPEVEAALTDRQMINRLQCEVAYLHQEIDFLKKSLRWITPTSKGDSYGEIFRQVRNHSRSFTKRGKPAGYQNHVPVGRRFPFWILSMVKYEKIP